MDDNLPTQQGAVTPQTSGPPQDQSQVPPVVPPVVQPAAPVGVPQKEVGPPPVVVPDYIKPSGPEVEPSIPPELAQHVEAVINPERPQLTDEDKKLGITLAKETVPVATAPTGMVQLPATEEEADLKIKTTKDTDSEHWLLVLAKKMFKKLRLIS